MDERRRAVLRIVLGTAQIMGATGAAVLLMAIGVNALTITVTAGVAALVVMSRLLLRNRG